MAIPIDKIPSAFKRQFFLEQQPQALGVLQGYNIAAPQAAASVSQSFIQQTTQKIVNVSQMASSTLDGIRNFPNNPNRNYLLVQNTGGTIMYVVLSGTQGVSGTSGLQILPGGYWEPLAVPVNSFAVNGTGVIIEGVIPS